MANTIGAANLTAAVNMVSAASACIASISDERRADLNEGTLNLATGFVARLLTLEAPAHDILCTMTHTLEPYSSFRPTGFDCAGLGCADQQDWLVAPCSITRDSEALSRANWQSMLAMLAEVDPDEKDHETHRFGHWGPGWFEIVLVRPESAAAGAMEECARKLDNYPVISDVPLSAVEHDDENESWRNYDGREFLRARNRFRAGAGIADDLEILFEF